MATPMRRLIRRLLPGSILGTLALAGTLLRVGGAEPAAPAPGPTPITIEIPVFEGGYGTDFYVATARQFEAVRPGVRVHVYGDPRIQDKLRVRMIDGDLPDATFTPQLLWPTLIRAGRVRELSAALAGPDWDGTGRWRDTFLPGALDSWRIDGGTYGVPLSYSCWTIFYNRALFRAHGWREPRTWDEFFALCDEIKAAGLAPVALTGLYGNYPDAFIRAAYYNLAGAAGWRALYELEPGAWADPRYARAAGILQRVTQQYAQAGWEGATHTSAQLTFLQGRAAMNVSGSWMIHEMEGNIPAGFEFGVMNFPVFADGIADPSTIQTGADCFFVFATGDPAREQATIDYLRFLTSRARATDFVRRYNSPVAVRGVPEAAYGDAMRPTAELIARARDAFNMPQVALQPAAIRQTLIDARLDLMGGRATPEQFAARVEAAAARDRRRARDPGFVEYRHPWAAGALLSLVAAVALVALARRRRGRAAPAAARAQADYFADLRGRAGAGLVGPAFGIYAIFVLLPGVASLMGALLRWDGIGAPGWAGLFNFKALLFESDAFWLALRNNLFLMVVPTLLVVPLALGFAWLFHRGIWGAGVFRVVFLFPNLLGGIAATLLWLNAYQPDGGLVNATLTGLGRLTHIEWLQSFAGYPWLAPQHLYGALVPIYVWMACGFNLILYLAAMEGVDRQLYEAAEIDGAPRWRQFWSITLPLIRGVIGISAVFIVIGGLNAFEMVWLLTNQDPDSTTHTLGTLMVSTMFKDFDIGRATAIAVVLFILVATISTVVLRALQREAVET